MKVTVEVVQTVEVTIDETKFTAEFMEQFRGSFFTFYEIEEHIEHLAQLHARGVCCLEFKSTFVEGYGLNQAMGISAITLDVETTVLQPETSRTLVEGGA